MSDPLAITGPPSSAIVLTSEAEHAAWYGSAPAAKRDMESWQADMVAMRDAVGGLRGKVARRIATRRNVSLSSVQQKFYAWSKEGWMALLNKARVKPSAVLPATFVEFWRGLIDGHQRRKTTVKQAFRTLCAQLEKWERDGGHADSEYAIPGYLTPPRRTQTTRLPLGWSYDTLNKLKPSAAERTLRSIGTKAYSMHLPPTRASRIGMAVGEVIFFDDEQPDVYVNFVGTNRKAMRPLCFHALDFVSGKNVGMGARPQILGEEGRVKSLTLRQFEWFVVWQLMSRGYRADGTGTTLVGELGTAKFSDIFSNALRMATDGKVSTDASGRFGDPAFRGMLYEGQSTGNFRFKAPLESWFNLYRNNMSALPGATGRNRDEAPEESTGLIRANTWFLKQLEELSPERRSLLVSPILEWGAFVSLSTDLIRRINDRRDHSIKDYAALNFTVPLLNMDGREFPLLPDRLLAMSEPERAKLEILTASGHARISNMSPSEVWAQHAAGFRKLRGWHVPALMAEDSARIIKVTKQFELVVDDQDLGSDPLAYIATAAIDQHGRKICLDRGEEYLCYLNPYDAGTMQVCEASGSRRGAWIGEVALNPVHSRVDQKGIWETYQAIRTATAPERSDIERRAQLETQRRTADNRWNQRVADTSKPLTPGEKRTAATRTAAEEALRTTPAPAPKPAAKKLLPNIFSAS